MACFSKFCLVQKKIPRAGINASLYEAHRVFCQRRLFRRLSFVCEATCKKDVFDSMHVPSFLYSIQNLSVGRHAKILNFKNLYIYILLDLLHLFFSARAHVYSGQQIIPKRKLPSLVLFDSTIPLYA